MTNAAHSQDPLVKNLLRKRGIGNEVLVSDMLKHGVFEMAIHGRHFALGDDGEKPLED
jgi:hypothetical protein